MAGRAQESPRSGCATCCGSDFVGRRRDLRHPRLMTITSWRVQTVLPEVRRRFSHNRRSSMDADQLALDVWRAMQEVSARRPPTPSLQRPLAVWPRSRRHRAPGNPSRLLSLRSNKRCGQQSNNCTPTWGIPSLGLLQEPADSLGSQQLRHWNTSQCAFGSKSRLLPQQPT